MSGPLAEGPLFDDMPDGYRGGLPAVMWPDVHVPPRPAVRALPRPRSRRRQAAGWLCVLAAATLILWGVLLIVT